MACTPVGDLDKENPNYQFLVDGMKDGKVKLLRIAGAKLCLTWHPLFIMVSN